MKASETMQQAIAAHHRRKQEETGYLDTYECAYRELLLWKMNEEAQCDSIPDDHDCLDGARTEREREIRREFSKQLQALKEKFGR